MTKTDFKLIRGNKQLCVEIDHSVQQAISVEAFNVNILKGRTAQKYLETVLFEEIEDSNSFSGWQKLRGDFDDCCMYWRVRKLEKYYHANEESYIFFVYDWDNKLSEVHLYEMKGY